MTHWTEPLVKGNLSAAWFLQSIWKAFSLWDDLIDKDVSITDQQINDGFWAILVDLPRNAFYQQHWAEFLPLLQNAILAWHASNTMEKGSLQKLLSCCYVDLIVACAFITGGREWAIQVAAQEWELFFKENHGRLE